MRKKLIALVLLVMAATTVSAVNPPVITMAGVEAAVKLSAKQKSLLAPRVAKLDEGLQKISVFFKQYRDATPEARAKAHKEAQDLHEECMRLLEEITAGMTPEQREAFIKYLHEQLKASHIDPSHFGHDPKAHGTKHIH